MGERVFSIGDLDYDFNFISLLVKIIDNGAKFIPCYHLNNYNIFKNLLFSIDLEILRFNKQIHLKFLNEKNKFLYSENDNFENISLSISEETCDSLECILEQIKCRKNNFKPPLYEQSLLFHLELTKNLEKLKFDNKRNLSIGELKALRFFKKNKPFKVVELDKNIGSALISNDLFSKIGSENLNNDNIYEQIERNPIGEIKQKISMTLFELWENKYISKELKNKLFNDKIEYKIGKFRFLPKLHKEKFSVRPIINYKDNPTSNLCLLIDLILRPLVYKMESYIKDSQNLIQKTLDVAFKEENILLYSCDFESLYTNINHEECLDIICEYLKEKLDSEHLKIEGFRAILKLVLKNNYFCFEEKYYKQKCGIAMGSRCGPSIANIFVYIYERRWLNINKTLFYVRFIDDIFIILDNEDLIASLKNAFGSLKLNICSNKKVNFLDLNISIDNITKNLIFTPYYKPTNTFSYLLTTSNHPNFIYKNIPKSLFIRLRRICTYLSDYIYSSSILKKHLMKRGYEEKELDKVFRMVASLDRIEILKYKEKKENMKKDLLIFKHTYETNLGNFNQIFKESFRNIFKNDETFKNYDYLLVNKMQNNISSILIHNFNIPFIIKNKYNRCENKKCRTCIYANKKDRIIFKNNYYIPICEDSDCSAKDCVYIIECTLCKEFYIGQTNCVKSRFSNHISCINNFVPFQDKYSTPISIHFNLRNHDYLKHLTFYIVRKDVNILENRLINESFFINLFKNINGSVINDYIPKISTVYNFNPE